MEPSRAEVVLLGTDHGSPRPGRSRAPPPARSRVGDRPFLLCLGHRLPAQEPRVRDPAARRAAHRARLGRQLGAGRSARGDGLARRARRRQELAATRTLAEHVVDLAAVERGGQAVADGARRRRSSTRPPTRGSGWFRSRRARPGCRASSPPRLRWASCCPRTAALLVPWDAAASAAAAPSVLADPARATSTSRTLRAAGAMLTWRRTGAELNDALQRRHRRASRDRARWWPTSRACAATAQGLHDAVPYSRWPSWAPTGPCPRDGQAAAGGIAPAAAAASSCSPRCARMYSVLRLICGRRGDAPERRAMSAAAHDPVRWFAEHFDQAADEILGLPGRGRHFARGQTRGRHGLWRRDHRPRAGASRAPEGARGLRPDGRRPGGTAAGRPGRRRVEELPPCLRFERSEPMGIPAGRTASTSSRRGRCSSTSTTQSACSARSAG